MHPFRAAVEASDIEAALALLSDDVVFRSPVVFKAYHGRDAVAPILHAVLQVFEDFRYVREVGSPDGVDHVLMFRARIGDREVDGSDFLHMDEQGLIGELTVMVRPMSAMVALAEAMSARLGLRRPGRRGEGGEGAGVSISRD